MHIMLDKFLHGWVVEPHFSGDGLEFRYGGQDLEMSTPSIAESDL